MSEKIKTAIMEIIKAHMDGEDKNTKAVLSDVMESVRETLEQQPCGDTISRSDMFDAIGHGTTYTSEELQKIITNLPPVTQKSKTGHWIHFAQSDDCSLCGYSTGKYGSPSKFCPNCGAYMVEPQERSEKE